MPVDAGLAQQLIALLSAPTDEEKSQKLAAAPGLLSDEALALLDEWAANAQDERVRQYTLAHRETLASIRAAMASEGPSDELLQIIEELQRPGDVRAMPRKVELARRALELVERSSHPPLWAALQLSLGNYLQQNPQGDRASNLEEAIQCYRDSLEVMTREANPADFVKASRNLSRAHIGQSNWHDASAALRSALAANNELYQLAPTDEARFGILRETSGAAEDLAFAEAKLGRPEEAARVLESSRARWLEESLSLRRLEDRIPEADRGRFLEARFRVEELRAEARLPDGAGRGYLTVAADLKAAAEALREWLVETPAVDPRKFAVAHPLVYIAATDQGGLALVVRRAAVVPVWLPALTDEVVRDRLTAWFSDKEGGLDELTRWLWNEVMEPVLGELTGDAEAVVIPCGLVAFLPLHAAWTEDAARPTGRAYATDRIALRYGPRASAISTSVHSTDAAAVLVVDEPQPVTATSLPNSKREAAAVRAAFDTVLALSGEQATRNATLASLPGHGVWHFSCHGSANSRLPLESGLLMAHDQLLTLRDVLQLRATGVRLVVLSACDTALPGTNLPSEVLGLPAGFLQAGAQGVISTMWPVYDLSTMIVMARFYATWRPDRREAMSPRDALHAAMVWVRDTTNREKSDYFRALLPELQGVPHMAVEAAAAGFIEASVRDPDERSYSHPYHWAAFSYTGV